MGSILFIIIVVVIFIAVLVYRAANKKNLKKRQTARVKVSQQKILNKYQSHFQKRSKLLSLNSTQALEEIGE